MFVIGTAAVVPLVILGLGATQVSLSRMTQKVAESQARTADQLASEIDLWLALQLRMLAQQVDPFNLEKLDDRKLEAFQRLVFQQTEDAHIVSIVNGDGSEIAPSIFISAAPKDVIDGKEVVSRKRFETFRQSLPTEAMQASRLRWSQSNDDGERPIVVGKPYTPDGRAVPVVPVVVPASQKSSIFLAIER